jgi:hypothetical protein
MCERRKVKPEGDGLRGGEGIVRSPRQEACVLWIG